MSSCIRVLLRPHHLLSNILIYFLFNFLPEEKTVTWSKGLSANSDKRFFLQEGGGVVVVFKIIKSIIIVDFKSYNVS